MEGLLEGMHSTINAMDIIETSDIIVLPCSHEINRTKKPCDGGIQIKQAFQPENKMNCHLPMKEHCKIIGNTHIDWSFYTNFYGTGTRGKKGQNVIQIRCRNTNFIREAVVYLNLNQYPREVYMSGRNINKALYGDDVGLHPTNNHDITKISDKNYRIHSGLTPQSQINGGRKRNTKKRNTKKRNTQKRNTKKHKSKH
jgi:hypothetical protein